MDKIKEYVFNNNLRILNLNKDEIIFRMGLWNYNEATLDLKEESESFKKVIKTFINNMEKGNSITLEQIEKSDLNDNDKANLLGTMEALWQSGMICSKEDSDIHNEISKILLGDFRYLAPVKDNEKKLLFIGDSDYENKTVKELSKSIDLDLDVCSKDLKNLITSIDVTSNLDALSMKQNLEKLKQELGGYCCILLCMQQVSISMLRNLNRVCIYNNIPVVTAFIDGPFINILSTKSPKTGCLECYEERILARLEDHILYHKFASQKCKEEFPVNKGIIPIMNIMSNLLVSEGFLIANTGSSKFEGRALSIYVPTLEIQVQDVLRVPFCKACGNVAKAKLEDINVSTRVVMKNIIESLED